MDEPGEFIYNSVEELMNYLVANPNLIFLPGKLTLIKYKPHHVCFSFKILAFPLYFTFQGTFLSVNTG